MTKMVSKKEMFEAAKEYGDVYYDSHFGAWIYIYHELGWSDEIVLGSTEAEAYKVFCEINW